MAKSMWEPGEYEKFFEVKGEPIMPDQRIVQRTTFRKKLNPDHTKLWQWYWTLRAANGQVISVGGEGYDNADSAINGFLSSQGHPDWKPGDDLPEGYQKEQFNYDHFMLYKFDSVKTEDELKNEVEEKFISDLKDLDKAKQEQVNKAEQEPTENGN